MAPPKGEGGERGGGIKEGRKGGRKRGGTDTKEKEGINKARCEPVAKTMPSSLTHMCTCRITTLLTTFTLIIIPFIRPTCKGEGSFSVQVRTASIVVQTGMMGWKALAMLGPAQYTPISLTHMLMCMQSRTCDLYSEKQRLRVRN